METILRYWEQIQRLFDINGDAMMFFFTVAIIYRVVKGPPLGPSEAAVYATAISAFAATKIKNG